MDNPLDPGLVEAAARALASHDGFDPDAPYLGKPLWMARRAEAEAAIGVVRASLTAEITAMPIPSGNGAAVLYERQGAVNFRLGVLRIVRGDTTTNGGDQ